MKKHPVEALIEQADQAINNEDFDRLFEIYDDEAVLVVMPERHAIGKVQIRQALEAIAKHFNHTLNVRQKGLKVLEAGDTALVLANTLVSANAQPEELRRATYIFKKHPQKGWLCVIDNSYGHDLIEASD